MFGFTLAEVLITLVIIGVIAAITVPTLTLKRDKEQTCTKLKKFHSVMTQAFLLYANSEGISPNKITFPSDSYRNGPKQLEWYKQTIGKYISSISAESLTAGSYGYWKVRMNDGSSFIAYLGGQKIAHFFYCTKSSCEPETFDGKTSFLFTFTNGDFITSNQEKIIPRETLLNGCRNSHPHDRHYCTRLIQVDGWQIKDDYPWL